MTRKRQDCIFPPLAANVPDSRILLTNAGGTGSGFRRRMERVVRIISKRSNSVGAMSGALYRQVMLQVVHQEQCCLLTSTQRRASRGSGDDVITRLEDARAGSIREQPPSRLTER